MRTFFYTIKQAFLQFFRNLNMGIASIFAITAMLLILSVFFIAALNVNMAAEAIKGDYDSIEIYLKDDVKEMAAGYECGMSLEGHNDIKEGDIVECYIMEEIPR